MAASMIPAGAGQSGTQSFLGGIFGLSGSNDDELKRRDYLPGLYWRGRDLTRLVKPADIQSAYDEFKNLYSQNTPRATANAPYYENLTKGIFEDSTTPNSIASQYLNTVGDYINRGRNDLGQQAQSLANTDALRMGLGNTAPSTANSIALSTRLGGLFAPLYGQGIANSAPFANTAYGQQKAWDQYRLGQFQNDPLTGYYDRAAYRSFEPLNQLYGGVGRATDALGNVLNRVIVPNVAGYDLEPGLSSRLNNVASGFMNLANFGTSLYGNIAGGGMGSMMGGMGGAGGGQGMAPQQFQQSGFNAAQSYQPSYMQQPQPQSFYSPPPIQGQSWDMPATPVNPGYVPPQWSPGNYTPPQTLGSYYPGLSTYYG